MNRSGSRYSILTSCLATLLACVLLSTGAAVPPSVAAPVHSMEDAAVLPQQAAAPSQAASLAGQTAKHTPAAPEAANPKQAPKASVASP